MIVLGYNTPAVNSQKSEEGPERRLFHNRLSVQAGAYQNSTWVVAVAKAGIEDGFPLIGGSLIVDPNGEIVAEAGPKATNCWSILAISMRPSSAKRPSSISRVIAASSITA